MFTVRRWRKIFFMSNFFKNTLIALFAAFFLCQSILAGQTNSSLTLWYQQPAEKWTEALPIGNGRLGAMIFGGVAREHLQLNESTLWAGGPYDPSNTNALATLPKVRQLIFAGKYDEATSLVGSNMMSIPLREMAYQTLGDLFLDFPATLTPVNYRRDLDLETATASVSFMTDGIHFKREIFSSAPDQVIVVRLTADKPGQISFAAGLKTPQKATVKVEGGDTLVMDGVGGDMRGIAGVIKFQARVKVVADGGSVVATTNQVSVLKADSVMLFIAAATSYKNYQDVSGKPEEILKKQIAKVAKKEFTAMHTAHVADYQKFFRRVQLTLVTDEPLPLPTDERIKNFANGNDPQLATLYFQFARYLLISCSRPGGQPATLQGLWNDSMNPPWDSKYTININTEMNYWPAMTANLAECTLPLTQMVLEMAQTGQRTAKVNYGARGWVAHHNTDIWRATGPVDGPAYGMWPSGGAWLCNQLFDNYLFTGDKNELKKIYPAMKGAAQFFLDTLVEEPTHKWLVTNPSLSPENQNPLAQKTSLTAGPTMDNQIIRDLFGNCIRATEILGKDKQFAVELAAARERLAPNQIGSSGQLQEWMQDIDLQSRALNHRHVSHLYGMFPSGQIDANLTPELAAAVKKSLEIRGDQATGWATAWRINLWARLHDGDHAFKIFEFLLSPRRTYPNMFDAHPPFQIDGNFGGASGIIEMLLQSQNGVVQLLPALPKAWPDGSVKGLRARGGLEVEITWKDGKLSSAIIRSEKKTNFRARYGDKCFDATVSPGQPVAIDSSFELR